MYIRFSNLRILMIWILFSLSVGQWANLEAQISGTIAGRVLYQGNIPPPQMVAVVKDTAICSKVEHFDEQLVIGTDSGIRYAVISLLGEIGKRSLQKMGAEPVLDQVGCAFIPRMQIVPNKTSVQILNNDSILHNFHTYTSQNTPVNLAHPGFIKKIEASFARPEKVLVKCDVHPWMRAWIIVVDHPFHAVTDPAGKYEISNIPPGLYQIRCWQEKLGEKSVDVEITPGARVTIDFRYEAAVQGQFPTPN